MVGLEGSIGTNFDTLDHTIRNMGPYQADHRQLVFATSAFDSHNHLYLDPFHSPEDSLEICIRPCIIITASSTSNKLLNPYLKGSTLEDNQLDQEVPLVNFSFLLASNSNHHILVLDTIAISSDMPDGSIDINCHLVRYHCSPFAIFDQDVASVHQT